MVRPVSIISTHQTINLAVSCVCPPIPDRRYDWSAFDADDCGNVEGYGATEAEAITNYLEELLER